MTISFSACFTLFSRITFLAASVEDSLTDLERLSRYEEGVSADPTENMSEEDAATWQKMNEEHGNKFKTASAGDQVEQDKMWAKGYRHILRWGPQSKQKNKDPLYGKTVAFLSKLVREDYPDEKGYKIESLDEPKSKTAADSDEKESKFEEGKPADPTENMSPEDKAKWDKYHGKVDKLAFNAGRDLDKAIEHGIANVNLKGPDATKTWYIVSHGGSYWLDKGTPPSSALAVIQEGDTVKSVKQRMRSKTSTLERYYKLAGNFPVILDEPPSEASSALPGDEKASRFEEGKPADPCKNMSDSDCAEWKKQNEAHKDQFKAASDL